MADQIPLSLLAMFSADGRVYSAFGHYIAPSIGRVLLGPTSMAYKGFLDAEVVPGCPVPVGEISALLDTPADVPLAALAGETEAWRMLAAIAHDGWKVDYIPMMPGQKSRVLRVMHDNGVRFGEVVR